MLLVSLDLLLLSDISCNMFYLNELPRREHGMMMGRRKMAVAKYRLPICPEILEFLEDAAELDDYTNLFRNTFWSVMKGRKLKS